MPVGPGARIEEPWRSIGQNAPKLVVTKVTADLDVLGRAIDHELSQEPVPIGQCFLRSLPPEQMGGDLLKLSHGRSPPV